MIPNVPQWAVEMGLALLRAASGLFQASTQEEIDQHFEDAAEALARAKIAKERAAETAAP